jgi:3-hydroxyacyl-CoA dehydrogenase
MRVKTVTVIGANGTMGCNVSGIFASFGDARVYMVCRSMEAANKAKERASLSVKAEAIAPNLIPKTYDDLEECISSSDLVFESVAEDISIKKEVYAKIAPYLKNDTIIGTGTSGLSINELSSCFDDIKRQNFMGLHMYNPPYNLTLCEVIPSVYTDGNVLFNVKRYLSDVLYRKVVEVKDKPAFMGNRIGFQFINEALQYAEKYKDNGGIDYIDSILGPFTGRSMAPLVTSDFVGLDVHKAIVDNVYNNSDDFAHETFIMPEFAKKLIDENKLGRKTGSGLYKSVTGSDGIKTIYVYDIVSDDYRPRNKYVFPFAVQMIKDLRRGDYNDAFKCLAENHSQEADICLHFLLNYVLYGIVTAKLIGEDIHSADTVMAAGYNWVPPLAVIDAFGGVDAFKKLAYDRLPDKLLSVIDIDEILQDAAKSLYDYRPFFKAK